MKKEQIKITDSWEHLKQFTAARIAVGRVGTSIPLKESLDFKLAHAHARDAVYSELDQPMLMKALQHMQIPTIEVRSRAQTRQEYLQRPDLGRLPEEASLKLLHAHRGKHDISIILADGLSAEAINRHAVPLLNYLLPLLKDSVYQLAPICIALQSRVALGDHIAEGLGARLSVVLIGERPGLSAADSIGAYLTFNPRPGLTDESRNCVSNIRKGGLPVEEAARKIFYLIQESFRRKLSGVELKDNNGLIA